MRLVTLDSREVAGRPGVMFSEHEVLDLVAAPSTLSQSQWIPQSVVSILAAGNDGRERIESLLDAASTEDAQARLRAAGALLPLRGTALMAPVRRPGLILTCGETAAEGSEPEPVAFIKSPNTATGQDARIQPPWAASQGLQARALPCVILGRPLHRATAAEAAKAVAAASVLLDFSLPLPAASAGVGEWRRYLDSKQFPGACPMGPALVTIDEWSADGVLEAILETNRVAGITQRLSLAEIPEMLAKLSHRFGFRPGDIVAFSSERDPDQGRRGMQDGDRVGARFANMLLQATVAY